MRLSFLLLLLFKACTGKQTVSTDFPLTAQIDALVDSSGFNGVILIRKGTNTLYATTNGFSSLEDSILLKADDQFVIGSISKQITAVLVMQAYEQGLLTLEGNFGDPILNLL